MREFSDRAREVSAALAEAGFAHDARTLQIEPRDDCVAVSLPDERIAWFPSGRQGRARLAKERRVLRLLQAHCHFSAPRVLYENESGWDVRQKVPGVVDPFGLFARVQREPMFAYAIGQDLGRILAEQHTRLPPGEISGWLPAVPNWPRREDLTHLAGVINDAPLLARIEAALRQESLTRRHAPADPVLVHADLGLHNIAVDPVTHRVAGVFDYEGALCGDRHDDFTYMVIQSAEEPMLDGALAVYEPATGVKIDRDRVLLRNAVAAVGFLAFRHGHAPEEVWCGRTLAEDLSWTDAALGRIGL